MAKIYSPLLIVSVILFSSAVHAQNVGIGNSSPQQKLDVSGAIRIGTTATGAAGSIRYNTSTFKFEGYDQVSASWKEFGGSADDDWTRVGQSPAVPNDGFDVYHTGNVGIGTAIPLTKLHVKGSGAIAIKAETSNSDDAIPAITAINTIGIAVRAETNSSTKPALFAYSATGLAIKAQTKSDTMPAIWAFSDSSYGIKAETKSREWPAIQAYNKDSTGYAFKAINKDAIGGIEGGNAAMFVGDVNVQGAMRNTASIYGGSVAVNDGLTVGTIAGAACIPVTSTNVTFTQNILPAFIAFRGNASAYIGATYLNNTLNTGFLGDCRSVTNFVYEPTFFDYEQFPLDIDLYVRTWYMGTVLRQSAKLDNNPPVPSNVVSWWSGDGGYYSKWTFSSNHWNGSDPNNINWNIECTNHNTYLADDDMLITYTGKIYYNWGAITTAPPYAAFGEIRASGAIYSHSVNDLGDVAEFFKVEKHERHPEPGDMVSISKENPNSFILTRTPNDPLIAGVISEDPSIFLNRPDKDQQPVALTGRVKVKVNLEGGKIVAGDAITSSSIEGVGMKANDGALIIGYALESFDAARTDVGKVWIFLSRTQTVKSSEMKIVQGKNFDLGGVIISGSQKVEQNQKSVFVPWNEQTRAELPNDVEFDDLVIDLTPYGGKAVLSINAVNKEGFEVGIASKSDGFKGFYYKAEIVSAKMDNGGNNPESLSTMGREERIQKATEFYRKWNDTAGKLMQLSGRSVEEIPTGIPVEQHKKYKLEIIDSWKKADLALYNQYLSLGKQMDEAIGGDQGIMRKVKGH